MKILFWNAGKNPLYPEIRELVQELEVDMLLLAEYGDSSFEKNLIKELIKIRPFKKVIYRAPTKIKVFFDSTVFTRCDHVHDHLRHSTFRIRFVDRSVDDVLINGVHLPSKVNWGIADQNEACRQLGNDLKFIEKNESLDRLISIGDFNMDPYEEGLRSANGLGAVHTKLIAKYRPRRIHSREYPSFYNPMWNFYGDDSKGSLPGTHFYNSSKYLNDYWYMFDQILIRPELIDYLVEDNLKIVGSIGGVSLLRESNSVNIIDRKFSDHLPLFAEFKF